ncbi:MAG: dockerin type I repeat-containing protein [Clostridia bacterium]|nr:dockerin type I repeat-containing protein [Clostridia bacterium]
MKKLLTILLTLAICLGTVSFTAFAADSSEDADSDDEPPIIEVPDISALGYNYALGAPYTILRGLTDFNPASCFLPDATGSTTYQFWGDIGLTKLTDGITAAGEHLNSHGSLEGVSVIFVGTFQLYEYVIDLGVNRNDIKHIVFRGVRDGYKYGNNRGFNADHAMIWVSDNKNNWAGRLSAQYVRQELQDAPLIPPSNNGTTLNTENFTYYYTLDNEASGRYVRIILSSPTYCLQLDEIEIYGNGSTKRFGDVNGDGNANSLDAAQVLKHDARMISLGAGVLSAADVNGDDAVDSLDAAQILKFDAMLIDRFPVEQ